MDKQSAKKSETGDEILGQALSAEWKMRAVKKLNETFGQGAAQEDLNLLRVLRAGLLSVERLSPEESVYDLGGAINFQELAARGIVFTGGPLSSPSTKIIKANGALITVDPSGIVTSQNNPAVQLKAPAPEQTNGLTATVTKKAYNIGDTLPDGWVVGPRSPKTGIVMALEPASGALDGYKTWHQGEEHAKELREQGHANARQPSADNNNDELNAIYNEVVKAGRNGNAKLNTSGSTPYGTYWSGTMYPDDRDGARIQCFDDGYRDASYKDVAVARVRCVRDEPGLTLA